MDGNIIHLDAMQDLFGLSDKLLKKLERANASLSYENLLQEAQARAEAVKSPRDMAPEEYKAYIAEKLRALPRSATQCKDDDTIIISDEGFAAMQADPEYEKWVLDVVAENLSATTIGFLYNGHKAVHQFGATKEEYRGTSLAKQKDDIFSHMMQDTKNYWEIRRERLRKALEITEELSQKRAALDEMYDREVINKIMQARALGLNEEMPENYISGVPASLLLAGLAPTGGGAGM